MSVYKKVSTLMCNVTKLRGMVPSSSCKLRMTKCLTLHGVYSPCGWTEVRWKSEWKKESRAGQSSSVYLLFFSALTARDRLALLNWALSVLTAALKLPDG